MLINLSNHLSDLWDLSQRNSALKEFGEIVDLPFPAIDPNTDENSILDLASAKVNEIAALAKTYQDKNICVHIMGEFNFSFVIIQILLKKGIRCIASTTNRISENGPDGIKITKFEFVRFRSYQII